MLQKEILEGMKVEELRKVCKECGISYYKNGKRVNKAEMINMLLEAENDEMVDEEDDNAKEEKPFELPDEIVEEIEKTEREKLERKKKYIEDAKVGTIVAFKLPNGKVISAAIVKKSTKGRKFLLETKYGVEHKVSFDDVLWVRTNNKRWPKGIYLLFKNKKMEVAENGEQEIS